MLASCDIIQYKRLEITRSLTIWENSENTAFMGW